MREKDIEDEIRAVLRRHGWTEEKNHQTALNKGRPDLRVGHPDWGTGWVEVKKPGGKLRDNQVSYMLKWGHVDRIVVCADPAHVLDLLAHVRPGLDEQREHWKRWATPAQRVRLDGGDPLADALSEFEG